MPLETYRAVSSQTGLFEKIVGLAGEGMSQRGVARSTKGTISKSAVSRMWEDKGREQLAVVRARPLDQVKWLAVMIDGVFIGTKGCVVIAIGIDENGHKQALDFEPGDGQPFDQSPQEARCRSREGIAAPGAAGWVEGDCWSRETVLARCATASVPGAC